MNSKQRSKDKKLKALVHLGRNAAIIQSNNEHLSARAAMLEHQLESKESLLANFRDQVRSVSSSSQELTHTLHHEKEKHTHELGSIQELLQTSIRTIEHLQSQVRQLKGANNAHIAELKEVNDRHVEVLTSTTKDLSRQIAHLRQQLIEPSKLRRRLKAKQDEIEKLCDLISDYRYKLGLPPDEYHPFTRQALRGLNAIQPDHTDHTDELTAAIPIDPATGQRLPDADNAAVAFAAAANHLAHVGALVPEPQYEPVPPISSLRGRLVDGVILDEPQLFDSSPLFAPTIPQSED